MIEGTHEKMSDYHASGAIGSSRAKQARKSLRLFKDYADGIVTYEHKDYFDLGTAIHAALLEPENFQDSVVVSPFDSFRTKIAQEWKNEMQSAGKAVVTQDHLQTVDLACNRAMMNADVEVMLARTEKELVYRTTINGLLVQCRFDAIDVVRNHGYDVKTTSKYDRFDYSIRDLGYDFSAGWYAMVYEACTGRQLEGWTWVVIESSAPYRAQLVDYCATDLLESKIEAKEVLDKLVSSMKWDEWDEDEPRRTYERKWE